MTEIEAHKKALKLWIWLFKNPGRSKIDYPDYDEISGYLVGCPLCGYYSSIDENDYCLLCAGNINTKCFNGVFKKWSSDYNNKKAAGYIASIIRRRLYDLLADKVDNAEMEVME